MKKMHLIILSLAISICFSGKTIGQSLSVSGSLFLPQDSIGFTFSDPSFSATDWIGIYKVGQIPGEGESVTWTYIKSNEGMSYLKAPKEAGKYKAFLCCCDGYDVIATSSEFSVEIPSLSTSFSTYVQGDSIIFSYKSPRFSPTDRIAIYPEWTVPGPDNQPISWKYITNSSGSLTFKSNLSVGYYDAYLLCCDGYDSISFCSFEVIDPTIAFLTPNALDFESGASLEFSYNDPDFAAGDWIGIYLYGEPTTGTAITWSNIFSKSGIVSFPGVLHEGAYVAVLFNGSTGSEYARSEAFNVAGETSGSYIKTAASVYPEGNPILVNYKDVGFSGTDWIGIYKKGNTPGGPVANLWNYAPSDSSTIEFGYLPKGDYIVYLFCCDGYDIKAKYDFKIVGTNTPSLVLSAIAYGLGDPLEFTYNDPNFVGGAGTDWIGIYKKGDIPSDVRSIIWAYLPDANGEMKFSVPYPNGTLPEENPDTPLEPGEYWAGLFCCDAYGLYAETSFIVTEFGTGLRPGFITENSLNIFPNPTNGLVNVTTTKMSKLQRIAVYNLTGQLIYQEKLSGVNQKTLDLKYLNKGVYFIDVYTENFKTSKKLIIQ